MFIGSRSEFYAGARQFIAGLALHEQDLAAVALGCPVADLTQLYAASRARQQAFQQTRDGKRDAFSAQRDAREAAGTFIAKSRDALLPYLGSDWSESWAQVGFVNQALGLAIPRSISRMVDAVEALEQHFKANPARQRPDLSVTEQAAKQARENLEVAVSTVARCKREQRTNRDLREEADTALAEKLAAGRKVLAAVMPEGNPRWLDFRADVPGDLSRPEGVEGVQWEAGLPGHITVRWNAAVRAESYVVQAQVIGVDEVFRNVATVRDTAADIALTPGAQVKVRVLARNASGPGVPSDEVQATVPPLAAVA
jgi:hypothetical protein